MQRILIAAVLALVILHAAPVHAEFETKTGLFTVNLGYLATELQATGEHLRGGSFSVGYQRFVHPGLGVGFDFGFLRADKEVSAEANSIQTAYTSMPFTATAKYYWGYDYWTVFGGAGLGAQFANLEAVVDGEYGNRSVSNFSVAVPVGFTLRLSKNVLLNLQYRYYYTHDADLIDDHAQTFNAGVSMMTN